MNSSIVLTFNSIPDIGREVVIVDSLNYISMREVFKEVRTTIAESENDLLASPYVSAFNYVTAFNLDYNNTSLYTITRVGLVVTITANNVNSQFSVTSNTTAGAVTTAISNVTPPTVFSLNTIAISQATTTPCDNVKLTITTNEQADTISSPLSQVTTTNPIVLDVPRQNRILVSVVKDGVTKSSYVNVPKLLSSFFTVNVLNTPSLASIKVVSNFVYTPVFTLEYSLDNTTWQTSNSFYNLIEGDYTVYIRDSIGCSLSIAFSVDTFTPNLLDYDGIAEISNLNPIRYKELVTWSDSVLKTPYNTLSFEEDVKNPNNAFTQPFIKSDVIKTQIKNNYSTISAKIIDADGIEDSLVITQMTENMNINDVRDAVILGTTYNGLNYVSVKYSGGNTYDPLTSLANGDYNLGTSVPSWMNAGDYVNITGAGWYKVLEVVYNTDAYVLVLNALVGDFPLALGTQIVSSVYNAVDYEIYEFSCDFSLLEGYYKVQVDVSDATFGSKTFLSEWLNIQDAHLNTHVIEYYNSVNNEINFNTGFVGKIRIPYVEHLKWKPNTEQDIYVTDTNTVSLESKYRGFWDFSTRPLPTMMAEKLTLILLQDRLFINTVNYLKDGDIESQNIGSQYLIKASLVKSDYVFDSNSGLGVGQIILEGTPLSIGSDGGFLLVE